MEYNETIDHLSSVSYVDLLQQIKAKCGEEEFCFTNQYKAIRKNSWKHEATANSFELAKVFKSALLKMALEEDPCIIIKNGDKGITRHSTIQFVKMPASPVQNSKKTKIQLQSNNDELSKENKRIAKENEELKHKLEQLHGTVDYWRSKANDLVPSEELFDNFPECYRSLDFHEWIPEISSKTGRRPSFRASDMWSSVLTNLPFVDTWQGSEHKARINKHSAETLKDAANGNVAKIASNRGAESRNVISQFFKFVKITYQGNEEQEFVPSVQHLLSKITVDAFASFYSQYTGSAQTAGNVAKIFTRLYYHMQTIERFQQYNARIQAIITSLLKYVQQMKQKYLLEKSKRGLDSHLLLRGEWLKSNELAKLNSAVLDDIVEFLLEHQDKSDESLKKGAVHRFQGLLILFCFLQLGGQRRELVASMLVGNFAQLNEHMIYFTTSEKVQKRNTDRLPIPKTLGQLIQLFIDKYRPVLLNMDKTVLSCWLMMSGKPLSYRSITRLVIDIIATKFPRRRVGPLVLRRIFVSAMQEVASSNMEEFRNWNSDHAALINTSAAVLDENYNRYNNKEKAKQTLAIVNDSLDLLPSENTAATIEQLASEHLFLDPEQRQVEKVLGEKFVGKDLHYLCLLTGGQQEWISHLILDPFSEQVLQYFDSFGEKDASGEEEVSSDCSENEMDCQSIDEESCAASAESNSGASDEVSMPSLGSTSSYESSVQTDEYMTEVVSVVNEVNSTRKRKRPDNCNLEVVILGDRQLKPGDVVSVNPAPSQSSQDYWLAVVRSITNEDIIKVQWLNKGKSNKFQLINTFDDIGLMTLNGHASGKWLSHTCYSID